MRLLPLLLASLSQAQVTITLTDDTGNKGVLDDTDLADYFGLARCQCAFAMLAEVDVGSLSGVSADTEVEILGGSDCDSTDPGVRDNCVPLPSFSYDDFAATSQEIALTLEDLLPGCTPRREEMGIYAIVDEGSDNTFEGVGFQKFKVDTTAPGAPTRPDQDPSPGDASVVVSWDAASGEDLGEGGGYQVFCTQGGAPVFAPGDFDAKYRTTLSECGSGSAGTVADLDPDFLCSRLVAGESARIAPLQNGVSYEFHVVAVDAMHNASPVVALGSAIPELTEDFYERYVRAGGTAQGGFCAMGGAAPGLGTALGVLVALSLLSRRRGGLALLAVLCAGPAAAAENKYASPQAFAAHLKFGPYRPAVDEQFGNGRAPYREVFGDDSSLLMQIQFDWQAVPTPVGPLGVGLLYGFFSESAHSLTADGRSQADETSLRAHTLAGLLVFRFDLLARHTPVPLVPYAQIGLDYYIWWVTEGDGSVANCPENCPFDDDPQNVKARGGAWGWQASPGIALLLDVFDPRAAKVLDSEMGINHSYAFFELLLADVDNFGDKEGNTLHLGDRTWMAGLAFEF